jgi:hypothetical protein
VYNLINEDVSAGKESPLILWNQITHINFKQNVIKGTFSRTAETWIILQVCDVVLARIIQLRPDTFSTP